VTIYRRLTLRRSDGRTYLRRWALTVDRIGSIKLHRMEAPDPGEDLHDHPWTFWSLVLWGGYTEERTPTRQASADARAAAEVDEIRRILSDCPIDPTPRGKVVHRRRLSLRALRLDECHRIVRLHRSPTWTLVVCGPRRRTWGFYPPEGYVPLDQYETKLSSRRDLETTK
jgi:hypothetical protein